LIDLRLHIGLIMIVHSFPTNLIDLGQHKLR